MFEVDFAQGKAIVNIIGFHRQNDGVMIFQVKDIKTGHCDFVAENFLKPIANTGSPKEKDNSVSSQEFLNIELEKPSAQFNRYVLRYPNGAMEDVSTVEAMQFLVSKKQLQKF